MQNLNGVVLGTSTKLKPMRYSPQASSVWTVCYGILKGKQVVG